MKMHWPLALVALLFALSGTIPAQEAAKGKPEAKPAATAPSDAELAAIRETGASFKKAFDEGNAKAVASHWTADGEFVDETGRRLQGRDAIEKEFAVFFKANPGVKMTSKVDQVRLFGAETAIEDGTDALEPAPAGATGGSNYTAVYVKRDGKWLTASVRETRIDVASNYGHLEALEHMIGTWVAENQGVEFEAKAKWIADKNFVEQHFKAVKGGRTISSGVQIIGWDPVTQGVTSWTFSSDGGHAVGAWSHSADGWIVESVGAMSDGTPTSAVNIISKLDDNAVMWRSVNRTVGAFRILDTNEVILRRKAEAKK